MDTPSASRFVRGPLIWTYYLVLGLFAFTLTMISPAVPFLRAEFGLDYTMASLHLSMFAIGMVASGLLGHAVLSRSGALLGMWGGLGVAGLGLVALVLAPGPWLSLPAILIASLGATLSMSAMQASLTSTLSVHRTQALIEANVMASLFSALPPLFLVLGSASGLGWRILAPAFLLLFTLVFGMGFRQTKTHQASAAAQAPDQAGRLPGGYWLGLALIFCGVATEWCTGFWVSEYLLGLPGRSVELATMAVVAFQVAAVAGRLLSSRLARRLSERPILLGAMALVLLGFPLYWLRADALSAFLGVMLCGAGVAAFYPLCASLAIGASQGRPRRASTFMPIASGSAIGLAPLTLGRVADSLSLELALWSIPIGLVLMGLLLALRLIPRIRA